MVLCIRASWRIDAKGKQESGLPPPNDSKEITLPSSHLIDLITATAELKLHINDQFTIWKGALEGSAEQVEVKEDAQEDEDEDD
jgi:hypothetical protein